MRRRAAAVSCAACASDGAPSEIALALIAGLRQLGAQTVLLTDGKRGAYVGNAHETIYCPGIEDVPVGSTAGAGDAFAATFAGVFAESGNYQDALIAATINAASVVMQIDAQSGLLTKSQLARPGSSSLRREAIRSWRYPLQ